MGFLASMSGKGNCYDNAVVETIFKTIKSELIWRTVFMSRSQAETAVAGYIDGFYNPVRRHSTLDFTSPRQIRGRSNANGVGRLHFSWMGPDSFDFKAMPSLNKMMVLELARCEYIERRENVIALGNSGTGKTHIALGLGLAACQKGLTVGFITAAALVHELIEARDEKRLLRFQKQLAKYKLLIIDELGFVPLSKTGAELLFEVFSQRYEGGSTLVTSNLPFDEWTEVFGSERLTGALLDRLTHHVHILEMNGDSYRLNQSQKRRKPPKT